MTGPRTVLVSGKAEGRFAPLADVFARLVASLDGAGAALCVYQHGRPAVDLTGGSYAPDTLQLLFSVSKAVTTVAVGTLVEAGLVDLDQPLAQSWPEFDRPGVDRISLRTVMSHRSGLAGLTAPIDFAELRASRDIELVALQEPLWPPDTTHGYHAFTFGSLVDGALRHQAGTTVQEVVADRVAGPLGLDLWIGCPPEQHARIAPVLLDEMLATPAQTAHTTAGADLPDTAFGALFAVPDVFNTAEMRSASWPAVSGVADARSLARMMAATLGPIGGVRLLGDDVRNDLVVTRSRGQDRALGVPLHYGTGFQLPFPAFPMLGPASYGHEAAGGTIALADTELGISVAFATNHFGHLPGAATEALAVLPAVRHCATASQRSTDYQEIQP